MDTSIRWLHLTDLHVGMHDQDWLWPGMRSKFFAEQMFAKTIKTVKSRLNTVDWFW